MTLARCIFGGTTVCVTAAAPCKAGPTTEIFTRDPLLRGVSDPVVRQVFPGCRQTRPGPPFRWPCSCPAVDGTPRSPHGQGIRRTGVIGLADCARADATRYPKQLKSRLPGFQTVSETPVNHFRRLRSEFQIAVGPVAKELDERLRDWQSRKLRPRVGESAARQVREEIAQWA